MEGSVGYRSLKWVMRIHYVDAGRCELDLVAFRWGGLVIV
jgi:hypothetical protein